MPVCIPVLLLNVTAASAASELHSCSQQSVITGAFSACSSYKFKSIDGSVSVCPDVSRYYSMSYGLRVILLRDARL